MIGAAGAGPGSTEIEFGEGTLYSAGSADSTLYTINPNNGTATGSVSHLSGSFNGLEFVGNTLYGAHVPGPSTASTLGTVNTTTGAFSAIGLTGQLSLSGLAYDTGTSTMWGMTEISFEATLVTVNLTTGAATLGQPLFDNTNAYILDNVGSIEFLNGVLYAGISLNGSVNPGGLYSINTANGAATPIGNTGMGSITGLTAVPVPAAAWLFGSGLLGLIGISRRKKAA
jgi:hypothetical protein